MSALFLNVLNMSISASWLVLAVLLLRPLFKKAPKWVSVLLWGFVAIRLICPFSIESALSLIPSAETVSPDIMVSPTPQINSGINVLNSAINPVISENFTPEPLSSVNPLQVWIFLAAVIWVAGFGIMLIYTAVSYWRLRRRVDTAVRLKNNIYQSEYVESPFVLGIFRPKIYLPFQIDAQDMDHVIAHEQAHIRRKDHWWKPFGFLLLALHWFNPLMWLGYILLCRDIELACDEKVIKEMDSETKADYTQALVACSVHRRSIAACPLAFGEVGVKERVKSVMNYKKPAFWIILAAIIICTVVAACFLTDPVDRTLQSIGQYDLSTDGRVAQAVVISDGETLYKGGAVGKEQLQELFQLRISRHEVSQDRSEERDRSYTVVLTNPPCDPSQSMTAYAHGTYIYFNHDFTQVWADDGVKPTLSYEVLEPEKAQSVYLHIAGGYHDPEETIHGGLKTYYKNADGTWQVNGYTYQYRLEITGRMPNAKADSTFVYLSNIENISFARAWRAAGLSSNMEDYFQPEEAVLVDWTTGPVDTAVEEGDAEATLAATAATKLDAAISEAIRDHHKSDKPDGLICTESHIILVSETVSGTPLAGQTGHIGEQTLYVYYLHQKFSVEGDSLKEGQGIYGQATITFGIDENGEYSLKHFIKPESSVDHGAGYSQELIQKFVAASEKIAENEETYNRQLLDDCWQTATEYLKNLVLSSE